MIGIDFDNTIAAYDELFLDEARNRGLEIPHGVIDKTGLRNAVRAREDGELQWQRLQAEVYGPRMREARLPKGLRPFLCSCRDRGVTVAVVSHKTRFAQRDETGTDLRRAALLWMRERNLLDPDATGLDEGRVHFEDTREEKVRRIAALGCSWFIDDLPEVFLEPGFPPSVERVLLTTTVVEPLPGVHLAPDWTTVADLVLS